MMTRNLSWLTLVLILSNVVTVVADEPPKLNVLFVMADDLRPELASFGSPAITATTWASTACGRKHPTSSSMLTCRC